MLIQSLNRVPKVYGNESRDFQLFGHIFDSIFNYSKSNIDSMLNLPLTKNTSHKFLELVANTLGFKIKHNYSSDDLLKLLESFKYILKKKGTRQALEESLNLLRTTQGIYEKTFIIIKLQENLFDLDGNIDINISANNLYNIDLYVPENIKDIVLFEDMLDYILPAGFTYSIFYASSVPSKENITKLAINDNVNIKSGNMYDFGSIDREYTQTVVTGGDIL